MNPDDVTLDFDDDAFAEEGDADSLDADSLDDGELEAAYRAAMAATDEAIDAAESVVAELTPSAVEEPAPAAEFVSTRPSVSPREIVEASLFVGAEPLSAKRLARLMETDDVTGVERLVDQLNADYDAQNRPYEIRLREGGYRMQLRADCEPVRDRLYGAGPREVKLPQEVVELLSVVAYQQPLAKKQLEELPRKSPKRLVGQLVRRGLVELRETEGEEAYVTTDRFLDVLGLRELDDLPQPQVLAIR